MTDRVRDFSVLGLTGGIVLLILALSGALGWIEAVAACLVMGSVALAYYVGSASVRLQPDMDSSQETNVFEAGVVSEIMTALPLPAFEVSADLRITHFNRPAADFLHLDPRRPSPPRASAIIRSSVLLGAIEQALKDPEAGGAAFEMEGGADQHWRAYLRPVRSGEALLVILEDLTPVRRAAQARADFLANASHELRTPLTAIAGFIETMRGPARDDHASWDRFLAIMAAETERMSRLIGDLLSLSRIESSEHLPPNSRERLPDIVSGAVDALQAVARERGLEIVLEMPARLAPVTANRDELIQVAENLISNAIKYSREGGQIRVSCGMASDPFAARSLAAQSWDESERMTLIQSPNRVAVSEPAVWLRVEDDGPGIERQHLPRLGERFYRADQSRGGRIGGTGLGLAIVKHIMAHHRGGLAVETRLGQGTAFGVWLPVSRPETDTPDASPGEG